MKNYKSLIVYLFLISATTFGQRGPMREQFKEKKDQIKVSIKGDITEFKSFKSTDQYKKLVESGIKVVFKQKEIERKDVDVEDNDFEKILRAYILAEKNSELYKLYEKIVNNRDMDEIIII